MVTADSSVYSPPPNNRENIFKRHFNYAPGTVEYLSLWKLDLSNDIDVSRARNSTKNHSRISNARRNEYSENKRFKTAVGTQCMLA